MEGTLHREIGIEKIWREVKLNDLVFGEGNSSPSLTHALSVLALSESSDFESPVLWLDGDNSFDPYRISELSRKQGLNSERVLEEIYISRAFTCYQMKSLILEKLENAVEEHGSGFAVITGLPGLFSGSDLSGREALRVFDPIVETLKSFRKSDLTIFLASSRSGEKNGFSSKLRSVSDRVIGSSRGEPHAENNSRVTSPNRKKSTNSEYIADIRSLEEFV